MAAEPSLATWRDQRRRRSERPVRFSEGVVTRLRDGTPVHLRPLAATDALGLIDCWQRLSDDSRFHRFFTGTPPHNLAQRMAASIDGVDHAGWVAHRPDEGMIGDGFYTAVPHRPLVAEVAFAVVDAYQGLGLGGVLLDAVGRTARVNGYETLTATVLTTNGPMLELLRRRGAVLRRDDDPSLVVVDLSLAPTLSRAAS
jgi:GNAT superfamily N-acetyltransferase